MHTWLILLYFTFFSRRDVMKGELRKDQAWSDAWAWNGQPKMPCLEVSSFPRYESAFFSRPRNDPNVHSLPLNRKCFKKNRRICATQPKMSQKYIEPKKRKKYTVVKCVFRINIPRRNRLQHSREWTLQTSIICLSPGFGTQISYVSVQSSREPTAQRQLASATCRALQKSCQAWLSRTVLRKSKRHPLIRPKQRVPVSTKEWSE